MNLLRDFVISIACLATLSLGASLSRNFETRLGEALSVKASISPSQKYNLGWTVDTEKGEITFEIEAETKGYVGFGLSPNGAMTGADLFIAGVDENETSYSGDYHGTKNGMPTLDAHEDWILLDAKENATHTIIRFSRALDTCDEEDLPITGDTSRVVWSIGESDDLAHHAERGTVSASFLTPEQEFDPSKFNNFTTMVDMVMPAQHTSYWCTLHKGPTFDTKKHVVAFEASLPSPAAEEYTHHFILNKCAAPEGEDPEAFFGQWLGGEGGHCYAEGEDLQPFFSHCTKDVVFVWAKGGKRMVFPENVGYPIGEEVGKPQFYMLEIHYDNPNEKEGVQFSTGLRTFYTDELREIEAGLLAVGHETNPSLVVPPKTENFDLVGHCSSECTRAHFPEGGITIFNSLLHAHLSGRKLKLRQFRNGEELPWVDNDAHYDFNFQQNKPLTEFRKVLPGDQLTYECVYDSTWNKKNEAITGGFSSRDEMCEGFFWHYPRVNMIGCYSSYPVEKGLEDFGITKYHEVFEGGLPTVYIDEPESMKGTYIDGISFKFNWTNDFLKEFQEKRRFEEHDFRCRAESGKVKYPEGLQEYVPHKTCEKQKDNAGGVVHSMISVSLAAFLVQLKMILM